jgi:hypothetical protein
MVVPVSMSWKHIKLTSSDNGVTPQGPMLDPMAKTMISPGYRVVWAEIRNSVILSNITNHLEEKWGIKAVLLGDIYAEGA